MLKVKEFNPARRSPLSAVIEEGSPPDRNRKNHEKGTNEKDEPAGRKECH